MPFLTKLYALGYISVAESLVIKFTDFGTNRKLIYDFLSVINTNLHPILYRFRDIAFDISKIAIFAYSSCV